MTTSRLVQRALEAIRRTLRRHPELRQRTADYFAGDLPGREDDEDEEHEKDTPHQGKG